jgi:uncharacterized membrane protein
MSDSAAITGSRLALLDVLRGTAIAAMILYHFFFDLEFFGLADLGVSENWAWIAFARAIPATFIAIAGVSLHLAHRKGMVWRHFWWRIGYLSAAAALVTVVSCFFDPDAIIWFGILHCIAASSILGLAFLDAPLVLLIASAALVLIAPYFANPALNTPWLLWLGLGTQEPPSDDYNPLFPWFAFVLIGIAIARVIAPHMAQAIWARWSPRDPVTRSLALAGRHSLLIYLMHQPILMGILFGISRLVGRL